MQKKVLSDHIRNGKNFVPPFINFANKDNNKFIPISWEDDTLPEIIWVSFIHQKLGVKDGSEFLVEMCRNVAIDKSKYPMNSMMMISNYDLLSQRNKETTINNLDNEGLLTILQAHIYQFIEIYKECPLNFLFNNLITSEKNENSINLIKETLKQFYERKSETSVFCGANVIYNQFVNGGLRVNVGLSLSDFPEIQYYPKTEKSKQIASAVYQTIKIIQSPDKFNSKSNWKNYFWQTTYNLEPCKI